MQWLLSTVTSTTYREVSYLYLVSDSPDQGIVANSLVDSLKFRPRFPLPSPPGVES